MIVNSVWSQKPRRCELQLDTVDDERIRHDDFGILQV